MEQIFLEQFYRWLKPGGVLVLVVSGDRLQVCDQVLAANFENKRVYRLTESESEKYKQIVLFGVRMTRRERYQLRDSEVSRARYLLAEMSRGWKQLRPLPDHADCTICNPWGPASATHVPRTAAR